MLSKRHSRLTGTGPSQGACGLRRQTPLLSPPSPRAADFQALSALLIRCPVASCRVVPGMCGAPQPRQSPVHFAVWLALIGATSVKLLPLQPVVMIPFDRYIGQPPAPSTICGRSRDAYVVVVPLSHLNSGPNARDGLGIASCQPVVQSSDSVKAWAPTLSAPASSWLT